MENSEKELKDVACVVFYPRAERMNDSIYLIDIPRGKLIALLHLNADDYPVKMAYVVHKSKLYMFGGYMEHVVSQKIGTQDAYVLDLFELAKTTGQRNVDPTSLVSKLPPMHSGRCAVGAVMVGDKILVFDRTLGYNPNGCHFEVFDPKQRTWEKLPDPFIPSPRSYIEGYYLKDDKLFVSLHDTPGIHELNFGTTNTPTWCHHDVLHGVRRLPSDANGVQIGNLVLSSQGVFDIENTGFAEHAFWACSSDIVERDYDVRCRNYGLFFRFGHDEVCIIDALLVSKPRRKLRRIRNSAISLLANKKIYRTLQPVLCKCQRRKSSCRLVVNVCKVEYAAGPIQLKVLRSFTVPMDYKYGVESGFVKMASLCDP